MVCFIPPVKSFEKKCDEANTKHEENGSLDIAYLIAHFGCGRALEFSDITIKQLESSRDRHFV